MKRLLVAAVALGLLASIAKPSQAVTVNVLTTDSSLGNDWVSILGIPSTTNPLVSTAMVPQSATDVSYVVPPASIVTFGNAFQTEFGIGQTGTFTNVEAWFDAIVNVNAPTSDASAHDLTIMGRLNGTISENASSLTWKAYQFKDNTTGLTYSINTVDPISGVIPHIFGQLAVNGTVLDFYVKRDQNLGKIGQNNTIEGVVNTTVPEPSGLALVLGGGVVGTMTIIRRRKSA